MSWELIAVIAMELAVCKALQTNWKTRNSFVLEKNRKKGGGRKGKGKKKKESYAELFVDSSWGVVPRLGKYPCWLQTDYNDACR